MASQFPCGITPEIIVSRGRPITTTKAVAAYFTKQHQHVTQRVETLECSEQFLTSNFSLVPYEHNGNTYKMYEMTKNGFVFLVMGFTGKRAAAFKEAYIAEFDRMEAELANARMPTGTLADLAGTARAPLPAAQDIAQSMMPAILEAIQSQTKRYHYPANPGFIKHYHTPAGVLMLTQQSQLMDLIRELEANGNDVSAPAAELVCMCNYITDVSRTFKDIATHAEYIISKSNG